MKAFWKGTQQGIHTDVGALKQGVRQGKSRRDTKGIARDFVGTAKFGIPWVVSPESSLGLQLDVGVTGLLSAMIGGYLEVGVATFLGSDSTIHPTLSVEVGVAIDYEVLP